MTAYGCLSFASNLIFGLYSKYSLTFRFTHLPRVIHFQSVSVKAGTIHLQSRVIFLKSHYGHKRKRLQGVNCHAVQVGLLAIQVAAALVQHGRPQR